MSRTARKPIRARRARRARKPRGASTAAPVLDLAEGTSREIARRVLGIENLDTRNRDALDFHTLAVWSVREALLAAYDAGRRAGRKTHGTDA